MMTLEEARLQRDLSQGQLAKLAGVSRESVNHAENGRAIHKKSFSAICLALEVSPDEIIGVAIYNPYARKRRM